MCKLTKTCVNCNIKRDWVASNQEPLSTAFCDWVEVSGFATAFDPHTINTQKVKLDFCCVDCMLEYFSKNKE